jgi:hypothetical protein
MVYVHATLRIKIGQYDRFCEEMGQQIPVIESFGMKLVGAWVTVVGPICTVIDLWELSDANAYFEAMGRWKSSDAAKSFRGISGELIQEELVTMVNKLPYSP